MSKKAFGGVGHGGSDPGAQGNGLRESNVNLDVALAWEEIMVAHGVITRLSRYKDENDTLEEEYRECNAFNPDVAIDFHTNAGGGDGFEVYCSINGGVGRTLAENIEKEVIAANLNNSRGVKTKKGNNGDYYGFIRNTKCPAVIIECAFIDNVNDVQAIDTLAERKAFGVAIAKATLKTLGITYKGDNNSNNNSNTEIKKEEMNYNMSLFSENWYLERNKNDVAPAVKAGAFKTGYEHYIKHGKHEGRRPLPPVPAEFNEGDYLELNNDVANAVKKGTFTSGIHHYYEHGFKENRRVNKNESAEQAKQRVKELEEQINKIKEIVK